MSFLSARNSLVDRRENAPSRAAQAIERASLSQAFEHALVDEFWFDNFAKSKKPLEFSICAANLADGLGGIFTDIFYRGQSKADVVAYRREIQTAFVNVGRQHTNSHAARFIDVLHDLIGVPRFRTEHR